MIDQVKRSVGRPTNPLIADYIARYGVTARTIRRLGVERFQSMSEDARVVLTSLTRETRMKKMPETEIDFPVRQ